MKILHVCESFAGGNFSSVTQICNGLVKCGHEVHLGFSRRPETVAHFSAYLHPDVRLHELHMVRSIDPITDVRSLLDLLALIREVNPGVIHLHSSKAGFLGRVAAFLSGRSRTVFYSPRGLSFLQQDVSRGHRKLFQCLEWGAARLGGTIIACSQGELGQVRAHIGPRRVLLIENAVDVAMVVPKKQRADGKVRIGTAGRISAARNPKLFAALAQRLRRDEVEFVWIGGGDEQDCRWLKDAGVRVTGWLPRQEALVHVAELDIYVQTSLWEGMPIAVIEAQVAGIPAVVTDVLGNRDIIAHGETGFIGREESEMADYLARLIEQPQTRTAFGRCARERALVRFNVERLLDELIAAYTSVAW